MNKFSKIIVIFLTTLNLIGCSKVLQTVELQLDSDDKLTQEEFNVFKKTLTIKEAKKQSAAPYNRKVLKNGRGENARSIPEKHALNSRLPKAKAPLKYKIGIGDTLTLSRLIENNRFPYEIMSQWPKEPSNSKYALGVGDTLALTLIKDTKFIPSNRTSSSDDDSDQNLIINSQEKIELTINSKGRIGSDGSVLLLEVGRLEASQKTLGELQSEVRNILIRNGTSPRFQLEIIEFRSQRAYLTINETSQVILLNDQKTTLREILTSARVGFNPGVISRIRLQRNKSEYLMALRSVFSKSAPDVIIQNGDHIFVENSSKNMTSNISKVGYDGNVVFAGIGRINVDGFTLSELRTKISDLIEKTPGSEDAFQIEVTDFSSKTALLSLPGEPGAVIPINDTPAALDEVIIKSGLSVEGSSITQINLQRQNEDYVFTLERLLKSKNQKIYLEANDRITVERLSYKENKVFVLGAVSPKIFNINPSNRETLADVLFTSGGVLSSSSAKRSEVYLLRGNNPVIAYHLDAQSPTRLIVADAMELRPNDILYVAEQPIMSFNRTLATILPLRLLLRDLQDENIP